MYREPTSWLGLVAAVFCVLFGSTVPFPTTIGRDQRIHVDNIAQDVFSVYDLNKDGHLDVIEVILLAIRHQSGSHGQLDAITHTVTTLFEVLERDGNGKIDISEFQNLQSDPAIYATNDEVFGMFQLLDLNRNGRLSVSEVGLSLFNGTLTEANRKSIEAVDKTGTEEINYAEFASAMRQHPVLRSSI
ncbi:calmodulin-domain kinase [Apostichopus japonicus]|uniref:Calmodulin-domain kinase n=1 Tax=Stichopus japonicus TaxID=307972 RepID=A0A2G8LPT9_STIJA|nr:calmodulin-domain kinase [Apostichopus japonicus]